MTGVLRILSASAPLLENVVDALILPLAQDSPLAGSALLADARLNGLIADMLHRGEFRGELGQVTVIPCLERFAAARLALVGLGKRDAEPARACRLAAMAAGRALGKKGLWTLAADAADFPLPPDQASVIVAEGVELSRYRPDPYRTGGERRETRAESLAVVGGDERGLREGVVRGRARNLARELVNEPSNYLDPEALAVRAREVAAEVGLQCEVLEEQDLERLGMGAILAVTRGSDFPARLIVLRHAPVAGGPLLALVGKAVMFDTGGISLKPSADMARMKGDMAGGAAVLGAMQAIAALDLPVRVVGLIPAAVNMPDGRAWKPGDVITAMSGKTIETISTDAEGRMLLADGIHHALGLGATHVVDIATLTGACVIALGHAASGLYGTDPELVEAVRRCGEEAGERHWPMPLFPEYREQIRSEIADLKNSGGRPAGSVTAAWFLREFAGEVPWAHLDIAGSSHLERAKPWAPAGPTGTGVGTFVNLAAWLASRT